MYFWMVVLFSSVSIRMSNILATSLNTSQSNDFIRENFNQIYYIYQSEMLKYLSQTDTYFFMSTATYAHVSFVINSNFMI